MRLTNPLACFVALGLGLASMSVPAAAQPATRPATQPAATQPAPAQARIDAVTLYEQTAMVTRLVQVPARQGLTELVVGPLPTSLQPESLYAESGEGVRVLTTRYRQRVERAATDEEVRALEAQLADLRVALQQFQASREAAERDLAFLQQMEGFTAVGARDSAGDARLDAQAVIALAEHITGQRRTLVAERVELERQSADVQQQIAFAEQQLAEVRAKADRTVREAVLVLDNAAGAATTVRLSYLVTAAGWRPHYKLRAARDGSAAVLEYLAAIQQQSGEDWSGVRLTLSTATPRLNAAPPELTPLAVLLVGEGQQPQAQSVGKMAYEQAWRDRAKADVAFQRQAAAGPGQSGGGQREEANKLFNQAAAKLAETELLSGEEVAEEARRAGVYTEGQSVTFVLADAVSIPWRDDEQLLEIDRLQLRPEYTYKAVPTLTPHVYRLAEMTNGSGRVILPGPAMMYLDGDFVGRTDLPLVATGEQFTAGLGVDPQLRVERVLLKRTTSVQGGNQVLTLDYALRVKSFKEQEVPLQLWDRLPQDQPGAVSVELTETSVPVSDAPDYLQQHQPKGLLRWDVTVPAGGELEVRYTYSIAFDRKFQIGGLQAE